MNNNPNVKIKDFQEAILNNPTVHMYMSLYMKNDLNYIETLKNIIIALANQNSDLERKLLHELNNRPARRYGYRDFDK